MQPLKFVSTVPNAHLVARIANILVNELKTEEEAIRVLDNVREKITHSFINQPDKTTDSCQQTLDVDNARQLSLRGGIDKAVAAKSVVDATVTYCLFFDGASRNNPGPAAAGAVLKDEKCGKLLWKAGKRLGDKQTCNFAEYSGLIMGLKKAIELNIRRLRVSGDSQLIVNQMKGTYKVKNQNLIPLHAEARRLLVNFDSFEINHVYRDQNSEADAIANQALNTGDIEYLDESLLGSQGISGKADSKEEAIGTKRPRME